MKIEQLEPSSGTKAKKIGEIGEKKVLEYLRRKYKNYTVYDNGVFNSLVFHDHYKKINEVIRKEYRWEAECIERKPRNEKEKVLIQKTIRFLEKHLKYFGKNRPEEDLDKDVSLNGFLDENGNGKLDYGTLTPFNNSETSAFHPDTIRVRTRFESAGVEFRFKL